MPRAIMKVGNNDEEWPWGAGEGEGAAAGQVSA